VRNTGTERMMPRGNGRARHANGGGDGGDRAGEDTDAGVIVLTEFSWDDGLANVSEELGEGTTVVFQMGRARLAARSTTRKSAALTRTEA
jgi:hypothetical protein